MRTLSRQVPSKISRSLPRVHPSVTDRPRQGSVRRRHPFRVAGRTTPEWLPAPRRGTRAVPFDGRNEAVRPSCSAWFIKLATRRSTNIQTAGGPQHVAVVYGNDARASTTPAVIGEKFNHETFMRTSRADLYTRSVRSDDAKKPR